MTNINNQIFKSLGNTKFLLFKIKYINNKIEAIKFVHVKTWRSRQRTAANFKLRFEIEKQKALPKANNNPKKDALEKSLNAEPKAPITKPDQAQLQFYQDVALKTMLIRPS